MNNIIVKKVVPMFDGIITTAEKYKEDVKLLGGTIINTQKTADTYRDYQRVVAVGNTVHGIEVGDLIHINFDNFAVRQYKENSIRNDDPGIQHMDRGVQYRIPCIDLDGVEHFSIHARDVDYIISEYEEYKETSLVGVGAPKLITK